MVSKVVNGKKQSERVSAAIVRQLLRHARMFDTAATLIELGQ